MKNLAKILFLYLGFFFVGASPLWAETRVAAGRTASKLIAGTEEYQCFVEANQMKSPLPDYYAAEIQNRHVLNYAEIPQGVSVRSPGWVPHYIYRTSGDGTYEESISMEYKDGWRGAEIPEVKFGLSGVVTNLRVNVAGVPSIVLGNAEETATAGVFKAKQPQIQPLGDQVFRSEYSGTWLGKIHLPWGQSKALQGTDLVIVHFDNYQTAGGKTVSAQVVIWPDGVVQLFYKAGTADVLSGDAVVWDGYYRKKNALAPLFASLSHDFKIVDKGQLRPNWISFGETHYGSEWFKSAPHTPSFKRSTYSTNNAASGLNVSFCGLESMHLISWDFSREIIATDLVESATIKHKVLRHGQLVNPPLRPNANDELIKGWAYEEYYGSTPTTSSVLLVKDVAIENTSGLPVSQQSNASLAIKLSASVGGYAEDIEYYPLTLAISDITLKLNGPQSLWFNLPNTLKLAVPTQKFRQGETYRLELSAKDYLVPQAESNADWKWVASLVNTNVPMKLTMVPQPSPLPPMLVVTPLDEYWNGSFQVKLTAYQGENVAGNPLRASQIVNFQTTAVNTPPYWRSMPEVWETTTNLSFPVLDFFGSDLVADRETAKNALSYSFAVPSGITYQFDKTTGKLYLKPATGITGEFTLRVTVSDGQASVQKNVLLRVRDTRFDLVDGSPALFQQSGSANLQGSFQTIRNLDGKVALEGDRLYIGDGSTYVEATLATTSASVPNGSSWNPATHTFTLPPNAVVHYSTGVRRGILSEIYRNATSLQFKGYAVHGGEKVALAFKPVALRYKGPIGELAVFNRNPELAEFWNSPYQELQFKYSTEVKSLHLQVAYTVNGAKVSETHDLSQWNADYLRKGATHVLRYPKEEGSSLRHSTVYEYTLVATDAHGNKALLPMSLKTPSDIHNVTVQLVGSFGKSLTLQLGNSYAQVEPGTASYTFEKVVDGTYQLIVSGGGASAAPPTQTVEVAGASVNGVKVSLTPGNFLVWGSSKVRQLPSSGAMVFRFLVYNAAEDERPYALTLKGAGPDGEANIEKWVLDEAWIARSEPTGNVSEWTVTIPHDAFVEKLKTTGASALAGNFRYAASVLHTSTDAYPDGYRHAAWTYPVSSSLSVGQVLKPAGWYHVSASAENTQVEWALRPRIYGQGSTYSLELRPTDAALQNEGTHAKYKLAMAQPAVPVLYSKFRGYITKHVIRAQWAFGELSSDADFNSSARWLPAVASDGKPAVALAGETGGTQTMRWPFVLSRGDQHKAWVYLERFSGLHTTAASLCARFQSKNASGAWVSGAVSCMDKSNLSSSGWKSLGGLTPPAGASTSDSVWLELIPNNTQNVVVAALGLTLNPVPGISMSTSLSMVPLWERIPNARLLNIAGLLANTKYEACAHISDTYANASSRSCTEVMTGADGQPYWAGIHQVPGSGEWVAQADLRSVDNAELSLDTNGFGKYLSASQAYSFDQLLVRNGDAKALQDSFALDASLAKAQNGFSAATAQKFTTYVVRGRGDCEEPESIPGLDDDWGYIFHFWSRKPCQFYNDVNARSPADLVLKDKPVKTSAEYRNVATPNIVVDNAAIEAHRIPLQLKFSSAQSTMAGRAVLTWTPGSNCEPHSTRTLEYGSVFPLENELVLIPSFAHSWSSSVGKPEASRQQIRHQWVDFADGPGGGFAPYGTGVDYTLSVGAKAPQAPRLSMAVDVAAAGDYELWVKPYGPVDALHKAFYWGWDSTVVARQEVLQQGQSEQGQWQKLGTLLTVTQSGRHTLDLFMGSEGFAFAAVAMRKAGTGSGEPDLANALSSTSNGWTVDLALEDLPSDREIALNLTTRDRYANQAVTVQRSYRTKKLPKPVADAEITLPGLVNAVFTRQGDAELIVSVAQGDEDYTPAEGIEVKFWLIGSGDTTVASLTSAGSGDGFWKYKLGGLVNTAAGYKYVLQARLRGTYQGKTLWGDWSALRFDVRQPGTPYQLAVNEVVPVGAGALHLQFEKGELKTQTADGTWYASAQFRVLFDNAANLSAVQQSQDLRMVNAEVEVVVRSDKKYDFVALKNPGTIVASSLVDTSYKENSTWPVRFGKHTLRISTSALQWQNGFLVAQQQSPGPVPVVIIDDEGVRRPVKSLKLSYAGVAEEFEVSGERFVLRNVIRYGKSQQIPSFNLEGCRTYFSHSAANGYRILAAGENTAQASSSDCAHAGPVLDFGLMHPTTDKEGYRFHHGLPEAVEVHYKSATKDYVFADQSKVWSVAGLSDTVYYDRFQMQLKALDFSRQGAQLKNLDLYLAPDLQHKQDSLIVKGLAGSWIKGDSTINDGHLHIYGNSQASAQVLKHRRDFEGQIPTRYTYTAPEGWEMAADERGQVLLQPVNGSASLTVAPVVDGAGIWDAPQAITVPIQSLRFSADGWDTLSAQGAVDLKSGNLDFKGDLTIAGRGRDYVLDFAPADKGVSLQLKNSKVIFDLEMLELHPDLRVRRLRAAPLEAPQGTFNVSNAPANLLQATTSVYALEDYADMPAIRLQGALLQLAKLQYSGAVAEINLPLGGWSTDRVQSLVLDGRFQALELSARFPLSASASSIALDIGSANLGQLQIGEVVLGLGKPAKNQTRFIFGLDNSTLTLGSSLARLGWKDQKVTISSLQTSLLVEGATVKSYKLDKLATQLNGAPRVLQLSQADLFEALDVTHNDDLVDSTKDVSIIELRTGEQPIELVYPSTLAGASSTSFDLNLKDLTLEFTDAFPVHGLRRTALQLNQLDMAFTPGGKPVFKVRNADLKAQKKFDRLVLLDPQVIAPELADPKKVVALYDVTLSVGGANPGNEWNGFFQIAMGAQGKVELLGKTLSTSKCGKTDQPANSFKLDWNGALRTSFCVDVNDTIPLYKENGKILVGFTGAAYEIVEGSVNNEIKSRYPLKFAFTGQAGGGLEPRFTVGVTGDFYFGHSGNYPQTLDFLAQNYSGQQRRLSLINTQVGIDKYGLRAERARVELVKPGWATKDAIALDLAALDLTVDKILLDYWRTSNTQCTDTSVPEGEYTYNPKDTEHCLKLEVTNKATFNLFESCSKSSFSLVPTLRANVGTDKFLKFELRSPPDGGLSTTCTFAGFQLDLNKATFAKTIDDKEKWGLFAQRVQLTANRPEIYHLAGASEPIWLRVDDFEFYPRGSNNPFDGDVSFGPSSAWSRDFKVKLLGLGLGGKVDPVTLFTGVTVGKSTQYGITVSDLSLETPPMMGSRTIPLGFSVLFNAESPYVHPIDFEGIGFNVPLKLSEAVRGEIGLELKKQIVESTKKERWVLKGTGSVAIPNFVREAKIDLALVKPDKINVTGIEEGRIMVKLEGGSRIPLGTTGLYITGLMGGIYDGYGQPSLSQTCAVGKLPPGLKGEMSVFIEDESGKILEGEVGVWVQMNALNFGVDGKLKLIQLLDAKICAALMNGVLRSKASVELDKALYVKGEFQMDVWSEKGKKNVAASASAQAGIGRGSIYRSRWFKIPGSRKTFGGVFTNFGRFTNGSNGFTAGVKVLGKKYTVGLIGGSFKLGGSYKLAQPPAGVNFLESVTASTWTYVYNNEDANMLFQPNEALAIMVSSSTLPWEPNLRVVAQDGKEYEILESSIEENRATLVIRFKQATQMNEFAIYADAPMQGDVVASIEGAVSRQLLDPQITAAAVDSVDGKILVSGSYRGFAGSSLPTALPTSGLCQMVEPVVLVRRAVETSSTGRVVIDDESALSGFSSRLDIDGGDLGATDAVQLYVGPKTDTWNDTLWQALPAHAFDPQATTYWALTNCVKKVTGGYNLDNCPLDSLPMQKGTYEFSLGSRLWSFEGANGVCDTDVSKAVSALAMDADIEPLTKSNTKQLFRARWEKPEEALKNERVTLQVHTSSWGTSWAGADETRKAVLTWSDPNGENTQIHGYRITYYPRGYSAQARSVVVGSKVTSHVLEFPTTGDFTSPTDKLDDATKAWMGNAFTVRVEPVKQVRLVSKEQEQVYFLSPENLDLSASQDFVLAQNGTFNWTAALQPAMSPLPSPVLRIPRNRSDSLALTYTLSAALPATVADAQRHVDLMARWMKGTVKDTAANMPSVYFSNEEILLESGVAKYNVNAWMSPGQRQATCRELVRRKPVLKGSTNELLPPSEAYILEENTTVVNGQNNVELNAAGDIINANDPSQGKQIVQRGSYVLNDTLFAPDACRSSYEDNDASLMVQPTPYGKFALELAAVNRAARQEPKTGTVVAPKSIVEVQIVPPRIDMGTFAQSYFVGKARNTFCFEVSRDLDWNPTGSGYGKPVLEVKAQANNAWVSVFDHTLAITDTTADLCPGDTRDRSENANRLAYAKPYRISIGAVLKNIADTVLPLEARIVYTESGSGHRVQGDSATGWLVPGSKYASYACPTADAVEKLNSKERAHLMEYIGPSSSRFDSVGGMRFVFSEVHNLVPLDWGVKAYKAGTKDSVAMFRPNKADLNKYWRMDESGFYFKPPYAFAQKLKQYGKYDLKLVYLPTTGDAHPCSTAVARTTYVDPAVYSIDAHDAEKGKDAYFSVLGMRSDDMAEYALRSDAEVFVRYTNKQKVLLDQTSPILVRVGPANAPDSSVQRIYGLAHGMDSLFFFNTSGKKIGNGSGLQLGDRIYPLVKTSAGGVFDPSRFEDYRYLCRFGDSSDFDCAEGVEILRNTQGALHAQLEVQWQGKWYLVSQGTWTPAYEIPKPAAQVTMDCSFLGEDEVLLDYPLMVSVFKNADSLRAMDILDSGSVHFRDAEGVELVSETEMLWLDRVGKAGNGLAWVRIPEVSREKCPVVGVYAGRGRLAGSGIKAWKDDYRAVWHFNRQLDTLIDTSVVAPAEDKIYALTDKMAKRKLDSAALALSSGPWATNVRAQSTVQLPKGGLMVHDDGVIAFSQWFQVQDTADWKGDSLGLFQIDNAGTAVLRLAMASNGALRLGMGDTMVTTSAAMVAPAVWYHMVLVYERGAPSTARLYLNGVLARTLVASEPGLPDFDAVQTRVMLASGTPLTQALFDEVRLMPVAPSANWIRMDYLTQRPSVSVQGDCSASAKSVGVIDRACGLPVEIACNMQNGDPMYMDRAFKIASLSDTLVGATQVRTAFAGQGDTSAAALCLEVDRHATAYVLQSEEEAVPAFLETWQKTDERVAMRSGALVSDSLQNVMDEEDAEFALQSGVSASTSLPLQWFRVYSKPVSPGALQLPGPGSASHPYGLALVAATQANCLEVADYSAYRFETVGWNNGRLFDKGVEALSSWPNSQTGRILIRSDVGIWQAPVGLKTCRATDLYLAVERSRLQGSGLPGWVLVATNAVRAVNAKGTEYVYDIYRTRQSSGLINLKPALDAVRPQSGMDWLLWTVSADEKGTLDNWNKGDSGLQIDSSGFNPGGSAVLNNSDGIEVRPGSGVKNPFLVLHFDYAVRVHVALDTPMVQARSYLLDNGWVLTSEKWTKAGKSLLVYRKDYIDEESNTVVVPTPALDGLAVDPLAWEVFVQRLGESLQGYATGSLRVRSLGIGRAASATYLLAQPDFKQWQGNAQSANFRLLIKENADTVAHARNVLTANMLKNPLLTNVNGEMVFVASVQDLADLLPVAVDKNQVSIQTADLSISGSYAIRLRNQGTASTTSNFYAVLYEDRNGNYVFDNGTDSYLGEVLVPKIRAGEEVTMAVTAKGPVQHPGALVWLMADPDQWVVEKDRTNNNVREIARCVETPALLYVGVMDPDSVPQSVVAAKVYLLKMREQTWFAAFQGDRWTVYDASWNASHQVMLAESAPEWQDLDWDGYPEWIGNRQVLNWKGMPLAKVDLDKDGYLDEIVQGENGVRVLSGWLNETLADTSLRDLVERSRRTACSDAQVSYPRLVDGEYDTLWVRVGNSGTRTLPDGIVVVAEKLQQDGSYAEIARATAASIAVGGFVDVALLAKTIPEGNVRITLKMPDSFLESQVEINDGNNRIGIDGN